MSINYHIADKQCLRVPEFKHHFNGVSYVYIILHANSNCADGNRYGKCNILFIKYGNLAHGDGDTDRHHDEDAHAITNVCALTVTGTNYCPIRRKECYRGSSEIW